MTTVAEAEDARRWLRERGFDVVVQPIDSQELVRAGRGGEASFGWTHRADLVSASQIDHVLQRGYGVGKSAAQAIVSARRRFASEQT